MHGRKKKFILSRKRTFRVSLDKRPEIKEIRHIKWADEVYRVYRIDYSLSSFVKMKHLRKILPILNKKHSTIFILS